MKILVTGFEAFGGEKINPSLEVLKLLPNRISNFEVVTKEIPTVFRRSLTTLFQMIEDEKPDVILCIGQAGGRREITLERVAINIDDARIPDNEGYQPIDEKIFADGENAYFSNLPIKSMVEAIRKKGLEAMVSNSAGTYVCNHLMYGLLYYINQKNSKQIGGFIHIPFIYEQVIDKVNVAAMDLQDISKGIIAAIEAININQEDLKVTGGSIY